MKKKNDDCFRHQQLHKYRTFYLRTKLAQLVDDGRHSLLQETMNKNEYA